MPTYVITIAGHDYEVSSPSELTDAQAYQAAQQQIETAPPAPPVDDFAMKVKPGEAGEWASWLEATARGAREGTVGGAKGFVEGVGPGVVEGLKGLVTSPLWLGRQAVAAGRGAYNLATKPVETVAGVVRATGEIPGKLARGTAAALRLAATDPEAFGKGVGTVAGATGVGLATGKVAPIALRPAARGVGTLMRQTGTKGEWPLRIMGAHQLGSGKVGGLATMTLPEMLQKYGTALERWGTKAGTLAGTPDEVLLRVSQDLATKAKSPQALLQDLETVQRGLIERRVAARLPHELDALQKEQHALDAVRGQVEGAIKNAPQVQVMRQQVKTAKTAGQEVREAQVAADEAAAAAALRADREALQVVRKVRETAERNARTGARAEQSAQTADEIRQARVASGVEAQPPAFSTTRAAEGERMTTRYDLPEPPIDPIEAAVETARAAGATPSQLDTYRRALQGKAGQVTTEAAPAAPIGGKGPLSPTEREALNAAIDRRLAAPAAATAPAIAPVAPVSMVSSHVPTPPSRTLLGSIRPDVLSKIFPSLSNKPTVAVQTAAAPATITEPALRFGGIQRAPSSALPLVLSPEEFQQLENLRKALLIEARTRGTAYAGGGTLAEVNELLGNIKRP